LPTKPSNAIVYFRKALLLDPDNDVSRENYSGSLRLMGLVPEDPATHVNFCDQCKTRKDLAGAAFEYREALKLLDDTKTKEKLAGDERMNEGQSQANGGH
jgi:hypothetical protein